MGGGTAAANRNPNPNPKLSSLNPNWGQLQQKIKASRAHKTSPLIDAGAKTLTASVLGKRKERPDSEPEASPPSALTPTSSDHSLTNVLSMDCEMVGVSSQGNKSALGRVALVNLWGNVVYNEYVRPIDRIVDFRTKISGIRPKHLKKAKEFWTAQKEVAELIKGRILVGHALHNDLKVLLLSHPKKDTRDTSEYESFLREGRRRALKDLAAQILGVEIQQKKHCPVEDARAAMFIYNKYQKEWEKSMKDRFRLKKKLKKRCKKKYEASTA